QGLRFHQGPLAVLALQAAPHVRPLREQKHGHLVFHPLVREQIGVVAVDGLNSIICGLHRPLLLSGRRPEPRWGAAPDPARAPPWTRPLFSKSGAKTFVREAHASLMIFSF